MPGSSCKVLLITIKADWIQWMLATTEFRTAYFPFSSVQCRPFTHFQADLCPLHCWPTRRAVGLRHHIPSKKSVFFIVTSVTTLDPPHWRSRGTGTTHNILSVARISPEIRTGHIETVEAEAVKFLVARSSDWHCSGNTGHAYIASTPVQALNPSDPFTSANTDYHIKIHVCCVVSRRCQYLECISQNCGMVREWWIGCYLEGNSRHLIEALFRHFFWKDWRKLRNLRHDRCLQVTRLERNF